MVRLQEDHKSVFRRLLLGVLDEAGATGETYIPLLLNTGVENLVQLGDVKQLRPMVIARDNARIDEKQANLKQKHIV